MQQSVSSRPFAPFEWMIAARYLRSRRKETFTSLIAILSFVGIMLGVATLIIVMAVMNGFRAELLERILSVNGHYVVQAIDGPFDDYKDVSERLEALGFVTHAVPMVEGQVLASTETQPKGALVRGLLEEDIRQIDYIHENVQLGTFVGFDEGESIAIGSRLALSLGVTVGDSVTLIAPRGNVTAFGVTPRLKAYPISAIFEIGMSEYDASLVLLPMAEAQAFFNLGEAISAIEVFITDPDTVEGNRFAVEEAVDRQSFVTDWRQRNRTFFNALQIERNVMFTILTLIILVAALNIVSGLIMLVKDKGKDIAILRTMGATSSAVMRIFIITGASIGALGTICGFFLGLFFCWNIDSVHAALSWLSGANVFDPSLYYLNQVPVLIDSGETMMVILMGLVLSLIATLYPAWRASSLDPVEALRYE